MRTKPSLDLADAKTVAAAAGAAAREFKLALSIAIVDDAGGLVFLERMDGARAFSTEIAIRKARTSASLGAPTRVVAERLAGRPFPLGDMMAIPGGVPIISGGQVAGAIGVSGAQAEDDDKVAEAGAKALAGSAP
ncbi:MAG: heme-binding protein [Bauldia sp.]